MRGYERRAIAPQLLEGALRIGTFFSLIPLVLCPSIASSQGASKRKPANAKPALITPTQYRSEWANVESCEQFKRQLWLLPPADDLLSAIASSDIALKTEFESKANFQQRLRRDLEPFISSDRVYLVHPLKDNWGRYDAERQKMTVEFPQYTRKG